MSLWWQITIAATAVAGAYNALRLDHHIHGKARRRRKIDRREGWRKGWFN